MVILTEKPSVAKDIAAGLGGFSFSKEDNWWQRSGRDCIVSAHGHLLELFEPADYDPKLKGWRVEDLPIVPVEMRYKKLPDPKKSLETIRRAFDTFGQEDFILATDAEREGELIGSIILKNIGFSAYSGARRFWVSEALTPAVVRRGFAEARPLDEYAPYKEAGYARQQSDWLIGINITRLLSCGTRTLCSFGRVQTAVLGAIYLREKSIRNFTPEPYREFQITLAKDGMGFTALLVRDRNSRFNNGDPFPAEAEAKVKSCGKAAVKSIRKETKRILPPSLFNITGLQKHCAQHFDLSPADTLDTAQRLYETHKCLSYPRTPSVVLGDDSVELFQRIFDTLKDIYPNHAANCRPELVSAGNKRIFNSAKLTDHHALIPLAPLPENATQAERQVYFAVTERFFNLLKDVHVYEAITAVFNCGPYDFSATGKTILDGGWKNSPSPEEEEEGQQLPEIAEGEEFPITRSEMLSKLTKPKKHFTDTTILALMENPRNGDDAGKLVGLGTPATRADILSKLASRSYITHKGKNILITDKGNFLIESIVKIPELADLISLKTTTLWEKKLDADPAHFLEETKIFLRENLQKMKVEDKWENPGIAACPLCGTGKILAGKKQFFCSNYKDGCQFKIWNEVCGSRITQQDAVLLASGKPTRTKKMKSKSGKEFTARLKLGADNKVEFIFEKKKN